MIAAADNDPFFHVGRRTAAAASNTDSIHVPGCVRDPYCFAIHVLTLNMCPFRPPLGSMIPPHDCADTTNT